MRNLGTLAISVLHALAPPVNLCPAPNLQLT